jgi:hypothetical protein
MNQTKLPKGMHINVYIWVKKHWESLTSDEKSEIASYLRFDSTFILENSDNFDDLTNDQKWRFFSNLCKEF